MRILAEKHDHTGTRFGFQDRLLSYSRGYLWRNLPARTVFLLLAIAICLDRQAGGAYAMSNISSNESS